MTPEQARIAFDIIEINLQKICIGIANGKSTVQTIKTIKDFTDERYPMFKAFAMKKLTKKEES